MHVNLFIATANQSGSTLLQHCFSECDRVAHLGAEYHKGSYLINEGHEYCKTHMPQPYKTKQGLVWTEVLESIQESNHYNWDGIKYEWHQRWMQHPAFHFRDAVLLEKSPHNLGRIGVLSDAFPSAYFIVQVRNPYAVAEGVNRRGGYSFERSAHHAGKCLRLAKHALENYENVLCWNYEILREQKDEIEYMVRYTVPYLDDFTLGGAFPANSIDGFGSSHIVDFNDKQIGRLNDTTFKQVDDVLSQYEDVMNFFGYRRLCR